MLWRLILGGLILLTAIGMVWNNVEASSAPDLSPFLYILAPHYEALAWIHGADRFASSPTIFLHDGNGDSALVHGFAASADPSVSFDGERILFAGKPKPADPWQIWELTLSDGSLRRVTAGSEDCIRPFYLPEDRIVYARKINGRFAIEAQDLSGGTPLQLTYGPANYLPSDILRDGRILFEAGYPLGSDAIPEIYTVYSDGSGVESYRCDHGSPRHSATQASSGDIIFASAHGLGRFTSARAQQVNISAPSGEYAGDPAETSPGDLLIPWRPNANATFQLMLWTPGTPSLRPVFKDKQADNILQPTVVAQHPVPNRHPSGLHDWPNANLLCLNAYTSKYSFPAGAIRSMNLYTRDSTGQSKLLGTTAVERDGSFFVHVPTEQPLQIELLDANGKTLKRESGFFWMRRGEQRFCVGCHAGPETAPENAVPMILLKSTTPADLTGATSSAAGGH